MKKIAWYWSIIVGLIILSFNFNLPSSLTYLEFFVGILGGLILIFFLNRQEDYRNWRVVMVFFVIATPLAMIGSYWGALFGNYVYILIFPQIVWGFFTWFGSVLIKMKMGIIAQIFIIALAIAVIGYLIFIFDNSNL